MNKNSLILIVAIAFFSCEVKESNSNSQVKSDKIISVFRIVQGHERESTKLSALSLVKGKLYYFANDTLLMSYSIIPSRQGGRIRNPRLLQLLKTSMLDSLNQNFENKCNCNAISENELIIRVSDSKNKKEFILNEMTSCSPTNPCSLINEIVAEFEKNGKR